MFWKYIGNNVLSCFVFPQRVLGIEFSIVKSVSLYLVYLWNIPLQEAVSYIVLRGKKRRYSGIIFIELLQSVVGNYVNRNFSDVIGVKKSFFPRRIRYCVKFVLKNPLSTPGMDVSNIKSFRHLAVLYDQE